MSFCVGIKIVMVTRGRSFAPEMTDKQIALNEERWVHLSATAHTCTSAAGIGCLLPRSVEESITSAAVKTRSSQFIMFV